MIEKQKYNHLKEEEMIHSSKITEAFDLITTEVRNNFVNTSKDLLNDKPAFNVALNAFNTYQEEERCAADCIFNIDDKNDLITLVKAGLTADDIAQLVHTSFRYFVYGENYDKPQPMSESDVLDTIASYARSITATAILFGAHCEAYGRWLSYFLTNFVTSDNDLYDQIVKRD